MLILIKTDCPESPLQFTLHFMGLLCKGGLLNLKSGLIIYPTTSSSHLRVNIGKMQEPPIDSLRSRRVPFVRPTQLSVSATSVVSPANWRISICSVRFQNFYVHYKVRISFSMKRDFNSSKFRCKIYALVMGTHYRTYRCSKFYYRNVVTQLH